MNIINTLIEQHRGEFIQKLTDSGFSLSQAQNFLPEAAKNLSALFQDSDTTDIVTGLLSGDHQKLLASFNTEALANKTELSPALVSNGINTLLPEINEKLSEHQGGIGNLVSSLSGNTASNLFSKAKSFFS